MWAESLESSLWRAHWKGFAVLGTNKCKKKKRSQAWGTFPQITGFYDISAFSNMMSSLKGLPQVALGTLNLICLRARLRRDCGQWGQCLFHHSAAFHLPQIYGSARDKRGSTHYSGCNLWWSDSTVKHSLQLLPLFPSDQRCGVDDWKKSRCCCWPVRQTVSWPRCGREAGGVGARWSGPAALWPSETRHVWWCRPCGGWSPPSLTAGWTHCAPGRQNNNDWMKNSETLLK